MTPNTPLTNGGQSEVTEGEGSRRGRLRRAKPNVLAPLLSDPVSPLPFVGLPGVFPRREQAVEPPGFGDLRRNGRRDVLVEITRLRLRDGALGQPPDEELALAPLPHRDRAAITRPYFAVRLCPRRAHPDLASLAGRLGPRARREKTRDVEPDVEADRPRQRPRRILAPHPASDAAGGTRSPGGDSASVAGGVC